jgi:SAM-dependent methyltransferase
VLDVGCGCGGTSLLLAASGAEVIGADISAPMLARARERAAGNAALSFVEADAATHPFRADRDLVFSRFGVMFFADPTTAFANLRSALAPGGRLTFLCWQPPGRNPWISVAIAALAPFVTPPADPPDPRAPGPFAFADPDYVRSILDGAGFKAVSVEDCGATLRLGQGVDEAIDFLSDIGPLSRALTDMDEAARSQAIAAVREALGAHTSAAGLCLDAACWLVRAQI